MEADKEAFLREFGDLYGYPNAPKTIDQIRATEFKRLHGQFHSYFLWLSSSSSLGSDKFRLNTNRKKKKKKKSYSLSLPFLDFSCGFRFSVDGNSKLRCDFVSDSSNWSFGSFRIWKVEYVILIGFGYGNRISVGTVYLDHAGATLYSELQMEEIFKDLSTTVYGNPRIFSLWILRLLLWKKIAFARFWSVSCFRGFGLNCLLVISIFMVMDL